MLMMRSNSTERPIVGLTIGNNQHILLSDHKENLMKQLYNHKYSVTTVIPGKNLKKIKFKELGIELLATDYIFAIFINKEYSAEIILSNREYSDKSHSLYVGMSIFELEKTNDKARYIDKVALLNSRDNYRYYIDLGLAVKFNQKNKNVVEFVIAQILE